jgi:hypothetical protein
MSPRTEDEHPCRTRVARALFGGRCRHLRASPASRGTGAVPRHAVGRRDRGSSSREKGGTASAARGAPVRRSAGIDTWAPHPGFLLGAEQPSNLHYTLEVQRSGHARDVEDADRERRRRTDREHVARGPEATHCSGDHSQARGVHETARRQVQRQRPMTPVDRRIDDGTQLGSREKVDVAPNSEHHLSVCELNADRKSVRRKSHRKLALFSLGASARTGRRGGSAVTTQAVPRSAGSRRTNPKADLRLPAMGHDTKRLPETSRTALGRPRSLAVEGGNVRLPLVPAPHNLMPCTCACTCT